LDLYVGVGDDRALVPTLWSVFDEGEHVGSSEKGRFDARHTEDVAR
jgi:hypothetical protein